MTLTHAFTGAYSYPIEWEGIFPYKCIEFGSLVIRLSNVNTLSPTRE